MPAMGSRWDIFCRVVDNYGDIGVCWRLARQLAAEHGVAPRLWVDDPAALAPMQPGVLVEAETQTVAGVELRYWPRDFPKIDVADVVVEAFACELPAAYLEAMARQSRAPRWINLEYLSAESWVDSCHGLASPHPRLPLVKHFFFPGFTRTTGGLLRENGLLAERDACIAALPPQDALQISLFCYDTAPLGELLDTWAEGDRPIVCHVPPGKPLTAVGAHLGGSGPWQRGQLTVRPMPFLPQEDYDRLLWRCDLNFVRGEDSFVRAQWAARPFVWHIYPQDDAAHLAKLDAFLDRYCHGLPKTATETLKGFFHAWNQGANAGARWPAFLTHLPAIAAHNRRWAGGLAAQPDLASNLVNFCAKEL
jgi:uncharacterized repeat protein (TIGR03837 family)